MRDAWRLLAACRDEDPELFFPIDSDRYPEALSICYDCPARKACAQDALDQNERWGIRAGVRLSWKDSATKRRRALQEVIDQ